MGDKPNAFIADNQKPILKAAASSDTILRDEVYIQLMKQLTMNPSADSAAKGWSLMIALINQGLPSEELSAFLSAFLKRFARSVQERQVGERRRSRVATAELRAP